MSAPDAASDLELWGGVECTINRVGDRFHDQLERCRHYGRLEDLDRFAALGIKRLRYPALWERVAPDGAARADWRWTDAALGRLRDLGIDPIVGLVHHGSGPASTSLTDPSFAERLAAYASGFAERYPWVAAYTPVNEPLTTARFSGLYGLWYPHRRDDASFVAALVNQCRATAMAMRAIRSINPSAILVQTEDAGAVRGTPPVARQVAFENDRRWLSIDLLLGRVNPSHPLWPYLVASRASEETLRWFGENATRPDVLGLNYYVTSDRFLDHRLDRYHAGSHGGNGRQRYADVEAARIDGVGIRGHAAILREAWRRYRIPLAITEVHLGCSREEQMRWLFAAWRGARRARQLGVDVRAITAWALLGSWDWNSLVTRDDGYYEPGVFDVRAPQPRETALGRIVRSLAKNRMPASAVLRTPGWWERTRRAPRPLTSSAPLLILGATGTLGRAFARGCERRAIAFVVLSRHDVDITNADSVRAALVHYRPWGIVNAAGYVRVDDAERDESACWSVNAIGPSVLAALCREQAARLLTFSSDLVFDGERRRPYVESDPVGPLNVYGRTKAEAERRVLAANSDALVIRTSAFFGPWDRYNFVTQALEAIARRQPVRAAADATVSPTYVPDLVDVSLDLLLDGASGLWHLANDGAVTWADLARRAAGLAGLDVGLVEPCPTAALSQAAPRPVYTVLGTERGCLMPPLDDSLARYSRDRERSF